MPGDISSAAGPVQLLADQKEIIVASRFGDGSDDVSVWNYADGRRVAGPYKLGQHPRITFSPSEPLFAVNGGVGDPTITLHGVSDGKAIQTLRCAAVDGIDTRCGWFEFARAGETLVARRQILHRSAFDVFDVKTGAAKFPPITVPLAAGALRHPAAFTHDGRRLIILVESGYEVIDAATGKLLGENKAPIDEDSLVTGVLVSGDDSTAVLITTKDISAWDLSSGNLISRSAPVYRTLPPRLAARANWGSSSSATAAICRYC